MCCSRDWPLCTPNQSANWLKRVSKQLTICLCAEAAFSKADKNRSSWGILLNIISVLSFRVLSIVGCPGSDVLEVIKD
jgi:hypothetical protein